MCETAPAVSMSIGGGVTATATAAAAAVATAVSTHTSLHLAAASLAAASNAAAAAAAASLHSQFNNDNSSNSSTNSNNNNNNSSSSESRAFNVITNTNAAKTYNNINNNNVSSAHHLSQPSHDNSSESESKNSNSCESKKKNISSERSAKNWFIEPQQQQQQRTQEEHRRPQQPPPQQNATATISAAIYDRRLLGDSKGGGGAIDSDPQKRGTTEDLIPSAFLSAEKILRDFNNFSNVSPGLTTTIINESDFPQLGVRWSPSFSAAGTTTSTSNDSPIGSGVTNFGNNTTNTNNNNNGNGGGTSMASSAATSPMVSMHGGLVSTSSNQQQQQQQQTSLQNAMFMRDSMMHMNRPYANLIRNSISLNSASNEFRMQNEDFPALPVSQLNVQQNAKGGDASSGTMHTSDMHSEQDGGSNSQQQQFGGGGDPNRHQQQLAHASSSSNNNTTAPKSGIQTHPDGLVTNIPANMLNDQYGMAGLLTFLRTIESDPSIVALALGHDLTNLGLNLNSSKRNLHQTFGGPWADVPCRIQDLDTKVPDEYLTNSTIREKLPNIKLNKLSDDVLFYLFYNCPGEVYQVAAASELFTRDWRFHKIDRVWLTRSPFMNSLMEHTGSYEKSSYNIFDPVQWRKIPKDMVIEYKQLEGKPNAIAAGSSPNIAAAAAAAAAQMAPNALSSGGGVASTPGMAPRGMMGMPMPPLQAHAAMAAAAAAAAQQLHPSMAHGGAVGNVGIIGGGGGGGVSNGAPCPPSSLAMPPTSSMSGSGGMSLADSLSGVMERK